MKKGRRFLLLLLTIVLVVTGSAVAADPGKVYTFGVVPQFEQRQLFAIWNPLCSELEKRTGLSLRLIGVSTISDFEKEFLAGRYDFVYMNPYHLLKAYKAQGYLPLVRGKAGLRGILVVRKESAIQSPAELDGKVVAFPSPNALGASLLMRADLARHFHVNISPLYVQSHNSVYLHVAKGLAVAGGGVEKTLAKQKEPIREALRILYATRDMPSHPIAVHPRVAPEDAEAVRRALLEIATTDTGRDLLGKIPMEQPVTTSLEDYLLMMDWGLENFWSEE